MDSLKAAASHPGGRFRDTARVCSIYYALKPGNMKSRTVWDIAFGYDPSASHLVGNR